MPCKRVLRAAVVGYILIPFALIGAVVDMATGSLYRLTPATISLELKPMIAELGKPGLFIDEFKELEDLKNSDTITEAEYARLKKIF